MLREDRAVLAMAYVGASLVCGLLAVRAGAGYAVTCPAVSGACTGTATPGPGR